MNFRFFCGTHVDLQVAGAENAQKRRLVRVLRTRTSLQISRLCLVQVELQVAGTYMYTPTRTSVADLYESANIHTSATRTSKYCRDSVLYDRNPASRLVGAAASPTINNMMKVMW
jgi:hypothetical protein